MKIKIKAEIEIEIEVSENTDQSAVYETFDTLLFEFTESLTALNCSNSEMSVKLENAEHRIL
jgi:hypothetical protein